MWDVNIFYSGVNWTETFSPINKVIIVFPSRRPMLVMGEG